MITAIIVDDEQHCIDTLTQMIRAHLGQTIHLLPGAQSIEEAAASINQYKPQLVFLDIEINDKSGFDLLKQFEEINFGIIFTTAYNKYAAEAFEFATIHYLLKPIEADKLMEAIERFKNKISKEDLDKKFETLSFNLNQNNAIKRIVVPTTGGYEVIRLDDIVRFEADKGYSNIHVKDKMHPFNVAKTLNHYEELLANYNFFKVHQSHLINMNYVKGYDKKDDNVILAEGTKIPVSTRRKDEFLKELKSFK